jgi:hypothetical protein
VPVGVLLDSSAILAWACDREERHEEAVEEYRVLDAEGRRFVITTDVFDEAVTLVVGRCGHRMAVGVGEFLRGGTPIKLIEIDPRLRDEAWRLFRRHSDHPLSFTDCTSIVTMQRLGITEVFSFDSDFDRAGLRRRPR